MLMKEFTAKRDDIALTQSIAINEFTLKTEKNALIELQEKQVNHLLHPLPCQVNGPLLY
jgi:hypothetical protein